MKTINLSIKKWPNKYRIHKRYDGVPLNFTYDLDQNNEKMYIIGGIIGLRLLIKFLEEKYASINNCKIIFTDGKKRFSFKENNEVQISFPLWMEFIHEVDKISGKFKVSKYYFDLKSTCRVEGIKKYFSDMKAETILPSIEKTIFTILELFLNDYDSLTETEKKALLQNIENSKVGALVLKRHDKLEKTSPKRQLKSVIANMDKLKESELVGLLNTLMRSKKTIKILEKIKSLPSQHKVYF